MTEFTTLLQQGNAWFFIPSAILLGALHGLEPGHSKTMMAAFIIAIKGTIKQAVMLGLALTLVTVGVGAAISVQQVAKRWSGFNTLAKRAPYFSSLLIGLVGVYMGVHGFMGIMR